jgi:hypothetical protein
LLYDQPMHDDAPSKQEEVVWNALITGSVEALGQFGDYRLVRLPDKPPPEEPPYQVASLGLWGYTDGVYPVDRMTTIENLPGRLQRFKHPTQPLPGARSRRALIESMDAILVAPKFKLSGDDSEALQARFKRVLINDRYALYLRRERVHRSR